MAGGGVKGGIKLAARVPDALRPQFEQAQRRVAQYFAERVEDPSRGVIEIAGDRYLFVRAASMSTEFFDLVAALYRDRGEEEARNVAASFLFDMAHALGRADARAFHERMGLEDPIDRLSAGPIHFAFSGWALVDISPESRPAPDDSYFLIYDHPYSFEADSWLRGGKATDRPICTMNAGYSSGWCEQSFGVSLVAVEVQCRAAGDEQCRFIMAPPARIQEHLAAHAPAFVARESGDVDVPEFFKRKRLEEELRQHQEHLEEMVAARTRSLRREIEHRTRVERQLAHAAKMEAIGQLAGGLAHDFNNLLTAVLAGIQMAQRHSKGNPRTSEWLLHALEATERAADLTRHMLTLSRDYEPQVAPVDLCAVVAATAKFLESSIDENITVSVECGCDSTVVLGSTTDLEHALINLAINSRDAMPSGGKLTFRIGSASQADLTAAPDTIAGDEFVYVAVIDTGTGIAPEIRDHIFEPLFTTKKHGEGLGFGLPRVYNCARAHGGWVTVDSEPGQGAEVRIYLPRTDQPVPAVEPPRTRLPIGSETILLVDDSDPVLYAGKSLLEACGYTVVVAHDGEAALRVYASSPRAIDLVVTDLVMPTMDGRGVLAELRKRGELVPVLLTSGHAVNRSIAELLEEGFAAFVPKPFDEARLAGAVRAALDAAEKGQ